MAYAVLSIFRIKEMEFFIIFLHTPFNFINKMTSKYEDFTPPRSNCTSDTRIAKACIGVTNKIQSNNDRRSKPDPEI